MSGQARKGRGLARLGHGPRGALRLPVALRRPPFSPRARSRAAARSGAASRWSGHADPPDIIYGKAEGMINKGNYGEAAKE